MKKIDAIIIHCSATKVGQDIKAKDIDRMHRARGFNQIGYNYVVDLDGTVETGRPLTGHIVSATTITVLAFAMSAGWTLQDSLLILGHQHRRELSII